MSLLRRLALIPFKLTTSLRGPKKKKEDVAVSEDSGDVINIFKDRVE